MAESELRLWEFEDCGFYAAVSKEAAFLLLQEEDSLTDEDVESLFVREVPGDELIRVWSEESWEDPRETIRGEGYCYGLELPAAEWAKAGAQGQGGPGYVFGGRE